MLYKARGEPSGNDKGQIIITVLSITTKADLGAALACRRGPRLTMLLSTDVLLLLLSLVLLVLLLLSLLLVLLLLFWYITCY